MKRNLDERIKALQLPPVPTSDKQHKKQTFENSLLILESVRREEMNRRASILNFFFRQMQYIGWKVWLSHAALLLAALLLAVRIPLDSLLDHWQLLTVISTVSPLLALVGMRLVARSHAYRMVELEMSTYYSLEHLILSRLCLFAIVDFIGLAGLAGCLSLAWEEQLGHLLLYLFTPFTVSAAGCLWLFNQPRIRDKASACSIFTMLLLAIQVASIFRSPAESRFVELSSKEAILGILVLLLVLSTLTAAVQLRRMLRIFRHLESGEIL